MTISGCASTPRSITPMIRGCRRQKDRRGLIARHRNN